MTLQPKPVAISHGPCAKVSTANNAAVSSQLNTRNPRAPIRSVSMPASIAATDCTNAMTPQATHTNHNGHAVPAASSGCDGEEITYFGMVPAETSYEGVRADKARTDTTLDDEGFHGFKAWCKVCGVFEELTSRCMLCDAPGPLRDRA